MSYCPQAPPRLRVFQDYEPFQSIPAISSVHNVAPRFGHTANITKLISGSPEEGQDYLRGLEAGGLAVVILFVMWVVVLIVVKCLGPKRVGWISGSRNPLPPIHPILNEHPAEEKDNDLHLHEEGGETAVGSEELSTEIWNERFLRLKTQDRRMKGCVIFSATAIVVCSILMVSLGVPGLSAIFDSGRSSLSVAIPLLGQAIEVLNVGEVYLNSTVKNLDELSATFNAACPNIRQDLCSDPQDLTTCSTSGVYLNDVSDDYNDALRSIRSARGDLERVNGKFHIAHDTLDDVEILLLVSTSYSVLLICLGVTLILSFCLTFPFNGVCWNRLRQVARFVFFPIFSIAVLAAFSFAIASIVVSTAMADACVNSPDHEVKRFLINEQQSMDDLSADVAQYFIDGCREVPNLAILNTLADGSNVLHAFATELQNTTSLEDMEGTCGPFDQLKWIEQSTAVSASMCSGSIYVNDLLGFLECSAWYGIYESAAHDTICYNVDNISLIAITQFLLVCFALIIATCRVAIYKGIEIIPEGKIKDAETCEMTPNEAAQIGVEKNNPNETTPISHDASSKMIQEEPTTLVNSDETIQVDPEETTQMIHDITRKDSPDEIGEKILAEIVDIEQRLLLVIENKFAELAQRR